MLINIYKIKFNKLFCGNSRYIFSILLLINNNPESGESDIMWRLIGAISETKYSPTIFE